MINNVVLVGRTTRDIELRKTQSGKSVASFTIAVNRTFKTEEQSADFINVVAWNHSADFLAKYVRKGGLIGVVGRIQTRSYDDKQGNRVYITEVVADSVQSLESKQERKSRQGTIQPDYNPAQYQDDRTNEIKNDFDGPTLDISSDDLPF